MSHEKIFPRKQAHVKLDMELFAPSLLSDERTLEWALCTLEGYLQSSAFGIEQMVRELMSRSHLFEFIFSVLPQDQADSLVDAIMSNFPTDAKQFNTSLASCLLSSLSLYFWSLDYPFESHIGCYSSVNIIEPVLQALSNIDAFFDDSQTAEELVVVMEDEDSFFKKRQTQKHRKKNSRAQRPAMSVDPKPFNRLGIPVPVTRSEALRQVDRILQEQACVLRQHFETLRKPELVSRIRDAYIPTRSADDDHLDASGDADKSVASVAVSELQSELPPAFPQIQPMKAAFHFDSVDGFGEWRILISSRADRNLREAKRGDQKLFGIILKKIRELSNGHFSDDNQKKLTGKDVGVPIFEAKMTRDTRLVYQVDCVREFETEIDRQVIRIFGIYTHAQLARGFWDAVGQHLAGKGKEYRKRCVYRKPPKNAGDNVFLPESFPPTGEPDVPEGPVELPNLRDEDREELHSLLVLQKFVDFSQALLNSILADQDVQHVFHMSPAEQAIVKHAGSCYVLGRSGTGKTTTMLFKMLGMERAWENVSNIVNGGISRPRQVFVTQSRVLAEKVEEYYKKLAQSHIAATRTEQESTELGAKKEKPEDRALVDQDEEELWRGSLPKKYSELGEEHFPMFITFDHLCRLLEEDFRADSKLEFTLAPAESAENLADPTSVASDYMLQRRESFVSYGTFLQTYWPHLPQYLTKTLDPALVFAEVMGVIKGSEAALKSIDGFIDEDTYVSLSHRQQGTFASRRQAVYSLFLAYLRLKRENRHWDAADRTHAILRGLNVGIPGKKLDFIYIDEAQDNLLIDALVIRTLCKNPDGLFWAGDTAQTISVGSSFRFDDLKAFCYRLEEAQGCVTKQPEEFQLTVNYRSHGGIVGCAHSVVQLITRFWPHAIDSLAEEKGLVDGGKPVFFSGWDQDTVQYEQFLFGASGRQIEFGAQQCILVRDDNARSKLQEQMGDIGLILTLYESKGLEFNDVLLYNFFEDSTVDVSQWRVILNALTGKKQIKCPTFDETRHSGVCRELKFLYVAITRARKNLWIADCSDKGESLRMFWTAYDLIKNCSAADEVPRLATSSTPEEWAATARTLFDNRRYLQARRCYERADLLRESGVAYAYYLREQARGTAKTRKTTDNARTTAFIAAAEAFLESATQPSTRKESVAYHRNAAECFIEAGDERRAADAYLRAEEFTRSAKLYRKAGSFDEAVHVVQTYRQKIAEDDAEAILDVAKLHYVKGNLLDRATSLFESFDDALEFMEDYGFEIARASLLESSGRLSEAAELHLLEGRPIKAIQLFLQDQSDEAAYQRAQDCILSGLWQHMSFSVTPKDYEKSTLGLLLKFAKDIVTNPRGLLSDHVRDQLTMFQVFSSGENSKLQELGERFVSSHHDTASGLLCLDRVFYGKPVQIQKVTASEAVPLLTGFLCYVRELQKVAFEQQPTQEPALQQLFGFKPAEGTDNLFILPADTFLHRRRPGSHLSQNVDDHQPQTIHESELASLIQHALQDRLKRSVTDENYLCAKARSIFPCPTLAVFGACHSRDCSGAHWNGVTPDHVSEFNLRIRLIFQQILIYQTISSLENRKVLATQQRFWLTTLYHTLFPIHHELGASSLLDLASIPESERAIQVTKDWIRDSIYNISPWKMEQREHFLSDIAELLTLAYTFDRTEAQQYVPRAKCIADNREWPPELMRGKKNFSRYIVHDLMHAADGSSDVAISAGVLFLHAVIEGQLVLDINVTCQLLEWICALFVSSQRLQQFGSFHDITLTRRWVLSLCQDRPLKPLDTQLLPIFLRPLGNLLIEVYSSSGRLGNYYLSYGRTGRIDNQIRNIFVARICRSLCLLGYNISDHKIRYDIHRTIMSIRQPSRTYSRIFFRYLRANGWEDQVKAFRNSATEENSALDELIQLKDLSKVKEPPRPIRGVRFVQYHVPSDIIPVMNGAEAKGAPQPKSKLRAEAAPFVPTRLQAPDVSLDAEGEESSDDEDDAADNQPEEDAGIDHSVDPDAAARTVDAAHAEQVFSPPTEDEIHAAQLISSFYRRLRSRRQGKPKKGLPEARYRWFIACQDKSGEIDRPYRCMFLGPLPHALVIAEKLYNLALASRKQARMRMTIARDADLEKVKLEVDEAVKTVKATVALKDLLHPSSELHRRQSIEELKQQIIALEQLSAKAPANISQAWEWDLKTALKGIVQERAPPKKQPKPELVVDSDDDYHY